MNLKVIDKDALGYKSVVLRADLDVPIENGQIMDDLRLRRAWETIDLLLANNVVVIIIGHLGRPKGQDPSLSLKPIAEWLTRNFGTQKNPQEKDLKGFKAWQVSNGIYLLENLRFDKREEENDPEFAKELAALGEIYINDAFASSHREHASIVGIPKILPSYAGFELLKEVKVLSSVLENPKRPLSVVIGGAKIETKLPLVEKMHKFADFVLVAGEIAEETKVLMRVAHENMKEVKSELIAAELNPDQKDITSESLAYFKEILKQSSSVVWNGPLGLIEKDASNNSSVDFAKFIAESTIYSIVGGGDTVSVVEKEGLTEKFDFVSTGGGAMLEFLSGEKLPGLIALEKV